MSIVAQPIKLEIPVVDKENAVVKPPIAAKLEAWQPPSPTKEELHQKLDSANKKRSKRLGNLVNRLSKRHQSKKQRLSKKTESDARNKLELAVKVDAKLSAAEDKRVSRDAALVNDITSQSTKKLLSATEARLQAKAAAQNQSEVLEKKLSAARERKELLLAEQIESLVNSHQDKASRIEEVRQLDKFQARDGSANLTNKMAAAERRRRNFQEKLLSEPISDKVAVRIEQVRARDEENAADLAEAVDAKLSAATERRDKVLSEKVAVVSNKAKAKQQRVEGKKASAEMATVSLRQMLDEKMERATERREDYLSTVACGASTSTSFNTSFGSGLSSPSKSPTKEAIDAKLEDAAARREAILLMKAEQSGFKAKTLMGGDLDQITDSFAGLSSPSKGEDDLDGPYIGIMHSPPSKQKIIEKKPNEEDEVQQDVAKQEVKGHQVAENRQVAEPPKFKVFHFAWQNIISFFEKLLFCFRK